MKTLLIEVKLRPGESEHAAQRRLERAGARALAGFEPVPMGADPARTVVLTMTLPEGVSEGALRDVDGVVRVYGSPGIAHF